MPGALVHQPRLMDEVLLEIARHHAYGSLGLEHDPELAFAGVLGPRFVPKIENMDPCAMAPAGTPAGM